jgi:methanogenic corrinoid protein MtbC1
MVYLRSKTIKGDQYLYLVKSVWDSEKSTSRQKIIKYLGKSSTVTKDDLPPQYRDNKNISSFFSLHKKKFEDLEKQITKFRKNLFKSLTEGDLEQSLNIYDEYRKVYGTTEFYEKIIRNVLYTIGDLWSKGKISIATEHISSNTAQNLINVIKQKNRVPLSKKQLVLICTPIGEEHCLGCNILESYLICKGFQVLNLSPSTSTDSILYVIGEQKPAIVLVSITLEDNLDSGQRLVKKIGEEYDIPIIVGGQALKDDNAVQFNAKTSTENSLNSVLKLIKSTGN